jgi:hypothetical protein
MWRAIAAGVSVVVAAASGVVTLLVTAHPSLGLWVALGVVVIVGAVLQAAVTYGERQRSHRVDASGAGAVAIGGSARGRIRTQVHGSGVPTPVSNKRDGIVAAGPGAVSVGGDAAAPVSTEVTADEGKYHDE